MGRKKQVSTEAPVLIDVEPENSKAIIACARKYKKAQAARVAALEDEVAFKQELLELVHDAKLKPLEDGKIVFTVNGMTISVTPRDELIKVKEAGDGDND